MGWRAARAPTGGAAAGAPTRLGAGAERILHSGGTMGGGDMGQAGTGSGPVQRPELDPARG